jgi:sterol 3beta-glucosyltransferase
LLDMRIVCNTHGTRGDVQPLVGLACHLAARDHDVTIAVPEDCRELAARAGLRTVPMPFPLMTWLSTDEGQRALHAGGLSLMRRVQREYRRHADAFDDAYLSAAQGAEALVGTFLTWDRTQVLGDLLRIPVATVFQQLYAPSAEYSSVVLTKGRVRSRRLRLASHSLTDRIWWHGAAKTTNAFRRKLGLPACSQSTFSRLQHPGGLGLHTISTAVFPRPADWPDHLKMTGAWQMPDAMRSGLGEQLPAELQAWLGAGDPPIFLGFGSMPVLHPAPLLDDIANVTATLGMRAIVSENCVAPSAADRLPDHLRVVGALDHDRLFPQCAAVVHHGGAGSTMASLRAGRPTMICSVFADQPWWGERVCRLRVGDHCRFRRLDRAALEAGLRTLLDPAVIARARTLGAAIQAEGDGLPTAADLLEDWLVVAEPTPPPRPTRRRSGPLRGGKCRKAITTPDPAPPRTGSHDLGNASRARPAMNP